MKDPLFEKILMPPGNEDLVWELFHENSKNSLYNKALPKDEIEARIKELSESLSFDGYPIVPLPSCLIPLNGSLEQVISSRISIRNLEASSLSLQMVATILQHSYGITREHPNTSTSRSLRTVPSGGALYPLEIFTHCSQVEGLQAGLYHHNPCKRSLRFIQEGDQTKRISGSLAQPELAIGASLIIFITALFERSIFKYQDRGYRYVLLEAGHVAQNINLVTGALGLGSINIGGFFDREIDAFLELDGVTHSTVYMIAVGGRPAT